MRNCELLHGRTSMMHNITIMICCIKLVMHGSSSNTLDHAADGVILKLELPMNNAFLVTTRTCYIGSNEGLTVVQSDGGVAH